MLVITSRSLASTLLKRVLRFPFNMLPDGKTKFIVRDWIARLHGGIPSEFLVKPGDTVVLVGFHRIDSVMNWSYLVGHSGTVLVVEAVPEYLANIRNNLEQHLHWPLKNITYCAKGVHSAPGQATIQIGRSPDFNKFDGQAIDDGLTADSFERDLLIETDTLDNILSECGLSTVDHIHMTISGMEVEALKGMERTLQAKGLRTHIRSLHSREGQLLYQEVVRILEAHQMRVIVLKAKGFQGANVYAASF